MAFTTREERKREEIANAAAYASATLAELIRRPDADPDRVATLALALVAFDVARAERRDGGGAANREASEIAPSRRFDVEEERPTIYNFAIERDRLAARRTSASKPRERADLDRSPRVVRLKLYSGD